MAKEKRSSQPRGRSGGRAGAAGYDFQDLYIAYQLTKLLMGDRDQPIEVLWEKKAADAGEPVGIEPVHVDDCIIRHTSGRWAYVQVKETAPSGGWSAAQFIKAGVARQFWRQWSSKQATERPRTVLRLASGGNVSSLAVLVDVARRSRTPAELLSDEAAEDTATDAEIIASGLDLTVASGEFLAFLKSLQFEQLASADDLHGQTLRALAPFGAQAADVAVRLIRLVAMSKHIGSAARSSFTRDTLLQALREDGMPAEHFIAAGVLPRSMNQPPEFWKHYRDTLVSQLRVFKLYGLQIDRTVVADLPSLFVPLRLAAITERRNIDSENARRGGRRSIFHDEFLSPESDDEDDPSEPATGLELSEVLAKHRRFALIGGPGSGKTTTLKWLALICAIDDPSARALRLRFGLPEEPLLPVFVRFKSLADRIRARGLEGVSGRVELVAEFLAVEFQAGIGGRIPTRPEALNIAEELLSSDKCVFLFDALDEVPDPAMRARLFDAVRDLIERYDQPRVVVSSRPYAFRGDDVPLRVDLFEPLPLSRSSQRTFARQWYRAVRSQVGTALNEDEADRQAVDLARAAGRVPDLAESPLLLSILALVHFNRQGLPVQRSVLYDQASLAMLGHWERDRVGRNLGEDAIPRDWPEQLNLAESDIRRVVEYLARGVQCGPGGSDFDETTALRHLSEGLRDVAGSNEVASLAGAKLLLKLLADRSGLLLERSPGRFGFVHLSFQDYLTARSFVFGQRKALAGLAKLAGEEKHAEVIRFAVAVLASEPQGEADKRGLELIEQIALQDALLAAACLQEAPRLVLLADDAERIARQAWTEGMHLWKRHVHPRFMSRLMWTLLSRVPNADELLLEFLALEPGDQRRPMMGPEEIVGLLTSRPQAQLSASLSWVLSRMAQNDTSSSWLALGGIAALVLGENGEDVPQKHLPALLRLLGNDHGPRDERGSLADRAERLLRVLYERGRESAESVRSSLEIALTAEHASDDRGDLIAYGAAKLLVGLGARAELNPIEVMVLRGFRKDYRHEQTSEDIGVLLADDRLRTSTEQALLAGLNSPSRSVRVGSARVLRAHSVPAPPHALLLDDEPVGPEWQKLQATLAEPTAASTAIGALADSLWDEDSNIAWRSIQLLVQSGVNDVPGLAPALVRLGLGVESRREYARTHLLTARDQPALALAVRAALLDGIRSAEATVAAASAILLIDMRETRDDERAARLVAAVVRDPAQIEEAISRLRQLVMSHPAPARQALATYYASKEVQSVVAAHTARLLVEMGYEDTPNLTKALVLGLTQKGFQDFAVTQLTKQLDDSKSVSDTRKMLSDGLTSDDTNLEWGCARCLWESGARTDPGLAAAIVRAGLSRSDRAPSARTWLSELLSNPRTQRKTLAAINEVASQAASRYRRGYVEYDQAWHIATCLLAVQRLDSGDVARALIVGGFAQRDRHDAVNEVVRTLEQRQGALPDVFEEELWSAVGRSLQDNYPVNEASVAWGAAKLLIERYGRSIVHVLSDDDDEPETRALNFLRTLLRESASEPLAAKSVKSYLQDADLGDRARELVTKLLGDKDGEAAFYAAVSLVDVGEVSLQGLPVALVRRGAGWHERRDAALRLLTDLRRRPLIGSFVNEALQQALWSDDEDTAWSAAVYFLDVGERRVSGLARALALSGLRDRGFESGAEVRLKPLLQDPATRSESLDALRSALLRGKRGRMYNLACLLVISGEPFHEVLLAEFDSDHVMRWWPLGPLCAIALSARVEDAISAARRFGLQRLADLLADRAAPEVVPA